MLTTPALKPYLELIRTRCENLSQRELVDLLCQVAQNVPAKERQDFLEKLDIAPTVPAASLDDAENIDEILSRIEEVKEDILERQESIEDGSYYEEYDGCGYGGGYYDEECPDSISSEQREELKDLFVEADQLFLAGELDAARQVYHELIGIFLYNSDLELYYEINQSDIDINWRETLSRYCRCVYETASSVDRVQQVLDAMVVDYPVAKYSYDPSQEWLPNLQDIFDACSGELAGWEDFLQAIQISLKENVENRAVLIFLEAVCQTDGIQGLAVAVRQKKSPVGYLFWLNRLEADALWEEVAQAALEALDNMPPSQLRTSAAAALIRSGEQTAKKELVLQGKKEQFFSEPVGQHLAYWLEEAKQQETKAEMLDKALAFLKNRIEGSQEEMSWKENRFFILKIKVLLLSGRLEDAYAEIDREAVVGWSNTKQTTAVVYTCILLALVRCSAEARTIHGLSNSYLALSGEEAITEEILQHLVELAPLAPTTAQEEWFRFAERMTTARIDHIVSNKYRNAYARAAEVLGGYMEALILNERKGQAVEFLNLNRNQKYNRFSAFRAEIKQVLANSPLLACL